MKRWILGIILLFILCSAMFYPITTSAWEGDGTVLNIATLPENWILQMDYLASPNELQAFSGQLGVSVKLLRNYVIGTPLGPIQINFVVTENQGEAEFLTQLFLGFHSADRVSMVGQRVMEIITESSDLIEQAKMSLQFGPELEDSFDSVIIGDYLEYWSWPVQELNIVTNQLQAELDNYRIFLVGESHGLTINQELESLLLQFFVREGQVQNYLLELSPSLVGFLREYLETGNEQLLDFVFSAIEGTYFWTKENYLHWQGVRTFWESLPEEHKFTLLGLDVEHQPILALQYLQYHLEQLKSPELEQSELSQIGRILRGERSVSNREIQSFLNGLLLELGKESIQAELGSLVSEFELVLTNLLTGIELYSITDPALWNTTRDLAMYNSFLKQSERMKNGKFFGQWGLNHVFQKQQGGVDWLASHFKQGEVFSMVLIYQDSYFLQNFSYEVLPFNNYLTGANYLAQRAQGTPLLVKLDGDGSPFSESLIWKIRDSKPISGSTTDYFQYILFLSGIQASSPLGAKE